MTINPNEERTQDYKPDENTRRNDYLNHLKQQQEEQETFIRAIIIMFIIFICVIAAILFCSGNSDFIKSKFGEDSFITKLFNDVNKDNDVKEKAEFSLPFGPRRQNILLLGVDASQNDNDLWTGTRTDTIILVNIDPKTKSVNAISIPRDSKVYLPDNNGIQKINAAHAIGGIGMTIRTVEDTLGVRVDKYIMVHDNAVKAIVEALGGVDVYVEKPMRYHDYAGKLHIDLPKGNTVLNGKQAVGYLRYRKDGLGDIGRTQRQQWFMRSLFEKLHSPQVITKIPEVLNICNTYVKTDMSFYELSQYAAFARSVDENKIEIATLPGAPNQRGYISYWILDPQKTQEVINRMIYRDKPALDGTKFKGGIMYSPKKEEEAMAMKEKLNELGFEVNMLKITHLSHTRFVANKNAVSVDFFNWLQKKMPELDNMQFIYDPTETFSVGSDFTVVLAEG